MGRTKTQCGPRASRDRHVQIKDQEDDCFQPFTTIRTTYSFPYPNSEKNTRYCILVENSNKYTLETKTLQSPLLHIFHMPGNLRNKQKSNHQKYYANA